MANRCNDWQGLLELANKDLEKCGTALHVTKDDVDGTFSLTIHFSKVNAKGKEIWFVNDHFAENYYEDEMSALINDAWVHARAKAKEMKLSKNRKKAFKKYQVAVVLGEYAAECYEEYGLKLLRKRINENEVDGNVISREFDSQAERNAYIMAMEDANGWWGNAVISNSDMTKHPRIIKSML